MSCEQTNICLLSLDKTLPNAYTEFIPIDKISNIECQCYCNAKLSVTAYVLYNNTTRKFIYAGEGCMKNFKKNSKNINTSSGIFPAAKYTKIDDMIEYSDMIESIILKGYTNSFEKNKYNEEKLESIMSELNDINLFDVLKEQILCQIKLLRNERERNELEKKEHHKKEMLRVEEMKQEKVKYLEEMKQEKVKYLEEKRIEKERLNKKYKGDEVLTKEKVENMERYIQSLTETEKLAMEIARQHLGSSFDITKSVGFLTFLRSR